MYAKFAPHDFSELPLICHRLKCHRQISDILILTRL
jgi:hypothetical protein